MDASALTDTQRLEILKDYRASGLTQTEYCDHALSRWGFSLKPRTLRSWCAKFSTSAPPDQRAIHILEAAVAHLEEILAATRTAAQNAAKGPQSDEPHEIAVSPVPADDHAPYREPEPSRAVTMARQPALPRPPRPSPSPRPTIPPRPTLSQCDLAADVPASRHMEAEATANVEVGGIAQTERRPFDWSE